MILLTIVVIVSYVLLQSFEMASFGTRVAGRMTNRVALGTTLSQTINTLSRCLIIFFTMNLTKVKGSPFNLRFFKAFIFREQCVVLVNNLFSFKI